ncbi:hypothetical protein ACQ4PT_012393 [Festuca glaucescens]
MEDLPEALLAEIVLRITRTSDLNSLSLVSKRLYIIDSSQRSAIRFGCDSFPAREALASLCSRFPNLSKVEIDYAGFEVGLLKTETEVGLRFLLGKCKSLERLCLEYVHGLNDNDIIVLSESCLNLKSISLWLTPTRHDDLDGDGFRTAFTDNSLKALALNCPMLEAVELTFAGCVHTYPSEIGFTQKGLVVLIQSCLIRVLVLNGANFFDGEGMMTLSSASLLETLELVDCREVTDAGLHFIARTPCLINLTLRLCKHVTDVGVAELVHSRKLESLIIECCRRVSEQAVLGAGRSVQYSVETASPGELKRMYPMIPG